MGGIIDCGIGVDSKTSPRRVAIEKAQEELRQEFDVREERRRELEFLEKGGNPLDFKFGHVATLSVQSTSLTDQVADQYVTSEAKGSFAFTASPRGDSVESSGKPGGSVGREPNIADNLLLLDGDNSNPGGDRNVKRSGKRSNLALMEQSSQIGSSNNAKESDDSVIFRFGVKSQAYARRNRSRSTRDSVNVTTSELGLHHGNRTSAIHSSCPDQKETKESVREVEDHITSSISNSKEASPNGNAVLKTLGSNYQLAMELDGVQAHTEGSNVIKNGLPHITTEASTSETLPEIGRNNQQPDVNAEAVTNGTTPQTSDVIEKEDALSIAFHSSNLDCSKNKKEVGIAESTNHFALEKSIDIRDDEMNGKTSIPDTATEVAALSSKKSDSSCDRMTGNIDGHPDGGQILMSKKTDSSLEGDNPAFEGTSTVSHDHDLKENGQLTTVDTPNIDNDNFRSANPNLSNLDVQVKDETEIGDSKIDAQNEVRQLTSNDGDAIIKPERRLDNSMGDSETTDRSHLVRSTFVLPTSEVTTSPPLARNATSTSNFNNFGVNQSKLSKKEHEDAILRKARMIEANLKKAGELSSCNLSIEKRQKCHWDFVLEEMAWMANDFMQERLWKTTAASQVCHWIASGGRAKFEQVNMQRKQENMARTLAKAVLHFWRSAETLQSTSEAPNVMHESDSDMSRWKLKGAEDEKEQGNKHVEEKVSGKVIRLAIHDYAVRFLKYNSTAPDCPVLAEAPTTPDRICSVGILDISYQLSEESLFYSVPPGAMQAYRESVESQWSCYKKMGNTVHQEDCETSMCGSVADGPQDNAYEEDEGETCTYLLPGTYKGGLSSKSGLKKRKNMQQRAFATQIYDVGADISYEPCLDSKSGNQPLLLNGKRPPSSLNVGQIPTKRIRTAARQRVVSPFIVGVSGQLQVSSKTDASSGDTNSYQDDQSSLHGGSLHKKNTEVESTVDFDRQLPYDDSEVSKKSKKKKKPKHFGYKNSLGLTDSRVLMVSGKGSYERRSEVDSLVQHDQKDHTKKRLESLHYDSNGNTVVYGQHAAKRPKLLKQVPDILQEAVTPVNGSMPSPVASQMSNMSNPNKLIKIIANRDRGRKNKALKMAAGNAGSGSPWSNFEDQALVVLVHDMGPNWELVSDAINSTLQFKCIFRKPKECKERHKFLMDKSAGDGADSAEDSGSSQPYPSTLPGIPKGSARQLFQRLQGPLEEDTLKAHFEKIILLGQQLHSRCNQNDGQEQRQITPPHSSHVVALQTCQNNLGGGFLTPLDLCDAITSSPEVLSLGYQGPHTNGISLPGHQGSISPILPTSNVNMLPGSPGIVLSSNLPSSSAPLSASTRDAQRYGVPRATSLQVDEQQRMQYNQILSGRNLQSSLSVPGPLTVGVDRGARMLPGGNGMGMMCGVSRGMPLPRPGFQGLNHPGMLNMVPTANMLSTNGHGIQNTVNVQQGAVSGPGSSILRPREPLPMMRPGQNIDDHRQMMMQELHMQVSQGNGQAAPPFSGVSAPFPTATASSPVQSFQVQQSQQPHQIPQQPHQMPQQPHLLGNPHHPHIQGINHSSPQQQAYAIRFAKERQIQQRMMSQPQHGFPGSTSAMASMQNSSQIQQPTQSSVSSVPSSQAQHKQQHMTHNQPAGSGMPNQIMKQRQRQQVQQQQSRQNQQQRQQSQQQAKLMKGLGRGSMLMHQNLSVDGSQASGFSNTPKNQVPEKNMVQQGQGFFPGNANLNPSLPQPGNQSKLYPRPLPQSSKLVSTMPSHSDSSNQGPVQGSPNHTLLASQQPHVPPSLPLSNHQQQVQINPSQQNTQRGMIQQNRQLNSDGRIESPTDQAQINQMIPVTSVPHCTDSSSSPVVSSLTHWKKEPSYDTGTRTSTAQLASTPHETLGGNEMLLPSSSQGLVQRQMSGGASLHGHNVGGQWQQQQSQQQQQQQPQHQHRPVTPGNVYAEPSNSGPG
ncbi:chromatin modification-related protein EAF1 B-like isoform X2 [Typha angustifolia]|uniref:chromatin modification-related protein EAF1 B-like isoform X2 n=1 Tax=Typha angustifolia TaxID=59011 RepID=UPI003C2EF521